MANDQPDRVVLRRTWPQRLVIIACLGVIGGAIAAAWTLTSLYGGVADIGRIEISGDLLVTDTDPSSPVNFLIIGTDSALGIDPDDPIHNRRLYDDRGTHNADSISLVRLDPVSGRAWVMSIPRDLLVQIPRGAEWKINAASLIGGAPLLVETVSEVFGVQINHYVQLDFLAFREVVEELGGVPVWFPHPTRDAETGLNIPVAGCHVLDGPSALAYVRSRAMETFVEERWSLDGSGDLGRIERQQSFVILALERAIDQGARNPATLSALINAGSQSVVLDQGLTPAELINLAEPFIDFDPETLVRLSPQVYDETGLPRVGDVVHLVEGVNEEMFDIFRGVADAVRPADVRLQVVSADRDLAAAEAEVLRELDFDVIRDRGVDYNGEPSIIVYPAGARPQAILAARYVNPAPALEEDPTATALTLILGSAHDEVSLFHPNDEASTLGAIAAWGTVEVPALEQASTTSAPASTTTAAPPTTQRSSVDGQTASSVAPTTAPPTTSTTVSTVGRAPEGESCG